MVAKKPKRVSKVVINQLKRTSTPTITRQLLGTHGLNNVSLRNVLHIYPSLDAFAGPAYTLCYILLHEAIHARQYLDHPENLMTRAVEEILVGPVMVMDTNSRHDVRNLVGNILMRLKMRKKLLASSPMSACTICRKPRNWACRFAPTVPPGRAASPS